MGEGKKYGKKKGRGEGRELRKKREKHGHLVITLQLEMKEEKMKGKKSN